MIKLDPLTVSGRSSSITHNPGRPGSPPSAWVQFANGAAVEISADQPDGGLAKITVVVSSADAHVRIWSDGFADGSGFEVLNAMVTKFENGAVEVTGYTKDGSRSMSAKVSASISAADSGREIEVAVDVAGAGSVTARFREEAGA